ncbi:hypothetical protein Lalb_Chr16g0382541 [Lupinus albus]|uniref:Uncharacterized protein n=1 Tax=Lupinus albus TaxID=3870 RepID=A0A6A4P5S2_LUPAL|nr:hypothetical protein Lalb_Chr16g0382541 [Lupinus albus]
MRDVVSASEPSWSFRSSHVKFSSFQYIFLFLLQRSMMLFSGLNVREQPLS